MADVQRSSGRGPEDVVESGQNKRQEGLGRGLETEKNHGQGDRGRNVIKSEELQTETGLVSKVVFVRRG